MPESVESLVRLCRRGMLWLVGVLSVLTAVAFVHMLITPDRIGGVSTGAMLIALVLLCAPGLTLAARRADRLRPAASRGRGVAAGAASLRLTTHVDRRRAA